MILISPSFEDGAHIPKKFSCEGGDINPELQIQNVPPGVESLALILHDPDAPITGGFTHWMVWNINPTTTLIKEESVPPGSEEGTNGAGRVGYMGPCPPSGTHHYEFFLYALDAVLDLPVSTTAKELEAEIEKHLVEKTQLTGLYQKQ
jgi:Raf kinase inhibitor-like YbhB/YbcL family protein